MRAWTRKLLNGYIDHPAITSDKIDDYIVPSSFGQKAGIVGCLTLAQLAYEEEGSKGRGAGLPDETITPDTCDTLDKGRGKEKYAKTAGYVATGAAVLGAVMVAVKLASRK